MALFGGEVIAQQAVTGWIFSTRGCDLGAAGSDTHAGALCAFAVF